VNRDNVTAVWALIFGFLISQEGFDAVCLDFFEVFHHAHGVAVSVTLVQSFQVLTRQLVAFVTESYLFLGKQFAASFDEAVLFSRKTTRTMRHINLFASVSL